MRAEPEPTVAEDAVADSELGDRRADGGNLACQFAAEDALLWAAEAADRAAEEHDGWTTPAVGFTRRTVGAVDRGGVDPDEDLVVFGDRTLDLFQSLDLWWTVPVIDHRSHTRSPSFRPHPIPAGLLHFKKMQEIGKTAGDCWRDQRERS